MDRRVSIKSSFSDVGKEGHTMRFINDDNLVGEVDIECFSGILL